MGALVAGTCLVLWMEGLCCLCPSLGTDAETGHVLPSAVAVAVVIGHSCLLTPTSLLAEMLADVPLVRNLFLIFGSTPSCRSGSSAFRVTSLLFVLSAHACDCAQCRDGRSDARRIIASDGARCRVSGSDNLVMSVVMSAGQVPLPIVGRCVKRYRNVRQF